MENKRYIISIKPEANKETHRIELSCGSLFSFRNCYLPSGLPESFTNPDTAEGREITAEEEAAFRNASSCLRAEKTALRLIARAEQCSRGLARKLEKRGYEAVCVNAVISRLMDLNLLDDQRFARLWLETRLRLPRSPRRLLAALCTRGIDRGDAETAVKSVLDNETEFALLTRFAGKQKRKPGYKGEENTRTLKYLFKNEGFSITAIEQYLEASASVV